MAGVIDKDRRSKVLRILAKVVVYIYLIAMVVGMVLPFYWSIITSFKDNSVMFTDFSLLPDFGHMTGDHWVRAFEELNFLQYVGNTLIVTVVGLFTNLILGSMAAYGFTKLRFKGRNAIFRVMLSSMMLPGIVTLVPQFSVIYTLGLYDTLAAIVLPGAVGVYAIFFMRQFIVNLSDEYREAGKIDGANEFLIFFRLYLPMLIPGMITLGVFTFNSYWNSYMWPSIVISSEENMVVALALQDFETYVGTDYGALMAGSLLICLPVLALFIAAQKFFLTDVQLVGASKE